MLYDQALVAFAALEAFALTADSQYLEMADNLLEFVLKELTAPEGGFYCALDADSEGREGTCYVWQKDEIEQLLGDDADLFCKYYGVTGAGNFEESGKNILHLQLPVTDRQTAALLAQARTTLLYARNRREQPLMDVKTLTAWNGLMIAALARAAALTGNQRWLTAARRAAAFINTHLTRADGRLLRSWCGTPSTTPAFLEDYACLTWGYLELYSAAHDKDDLKMATSLSKEALPLFSDDTGRLLLAGHDAEQMPLNYATCHDGVIPSALSVLHANLLRLAEYDGDATWRGVAKTVAESCVSRIKEAPVNSVWMLFETGI